MYIYENKMYKTIYIYSQLFIFGYYCFGETLLKGVFAKYKKQINISQDGNYLYVHILVKICKKQRAEFKNQISAAAAAEFWILNFGIKNVW